MILQAIQSCCIGYQNLARVIGATQMHVWDKNLVSHDALHSKGLYTSGREQYDDLLRIVQACSTHSCTSQDPIFFACLPEARHFSPLVFMQLNMLHI